LQGCFLKPSLKEAYFSIDLLEDCVALTDLEVYNINISCTEFTLKLTEQPQAQWL